MIYIYRGEAPHTACRQVGKLGHCRRNAALPAEGWLKVSRPCTLLQEMSITETNHHIFLKNNFTLHQIPVFVFCAI